jgi:Protein of unknown function (DUF3754)
MTQVEAHGEQAAVSDDRGHFIPVRKIDILDALIEHGHLASETEREQFRQVCRLLGAIYHYEYFAQLERLREDYFYFNPELDPHARFDEAALERSYADLIESFTAVLKGANFVELSHADVADWHGEHALTSVRVEAALDDYRDVRFFRRGHHKESVEISTWFGLRKHKAEPTVYDDVVLLVALKPEGAIASKRNVKRLRHSRIRPGCVLIKYFRNIARGDLHALFPNVRVVMSVVDKLKLGLPALVGGVPILINLASTVTVLFLVIGFYLGLSAAIEDNQMKTAFAALSGLVALGGFMMRQWVKYQRQSLIYQKVITDNIYFRNVNNNAGIFDYIIGAAEEQECKEAFLAYYFLRTLPAPPTQDELDQKIEQWLLETYGLDIDFEVDDALAKLERLQLLRRDGERLSVPPPEAALERLDYVWDNYFQYNAGASPAATPVPTQHSTNTV